MKKYVLVSVIKWLFVSVTAIFITSFVVLLVESQNQKMTVTVTVEPQRVIIVDKNLTIMQIISNTELDIRPIVLLGSQDGSELPYTESIMRQYFFLKPTLNFSQPGILYDRDERAPVALIKLVARTIMKWLAIPF